MTPIFMQKHLGSLRPVDEAGEDLLKRIKGGAVVTVEIKQPRNIKHHRMFWALVSIVFENQDHYESKEHMVVALKVALGHCDTVITRDGGVAYIPKSISFAKMDQTAFAAFFDKTCDIIIKRFLPGVSKHDLYEEVAIMVGAAPRDVEFDQPYALAAE